MGYITLSSGLTLQIPERGQRNWADTILNETFKKISSHDHTGSGKGVTIGTNALSAAAVTEAKIADGNVTLAKLANIATDRLIGRDTAGTGVPEALTVSGGVEFSGSGGIQRSALTGDVTASAGSNSTTIANNAVTTAKIADSNVTTAKIADDNVTTVKIADGNITEAKLADDAATRSCNIISAYGSGSGTSAITERPIVGSTSANTLNMVKGGKITHLSISASSNVTAGTITITLYKNGVTTGQSITLTTGNINYGAITPISYAAGDTISLATTLASVSMSGSAQYIFQAWGHFTE